MNDEKMMTRKSPLNKGLRTIRHQIIKKKQKVILTKHNMNTRKISCAQAKQIDILQMLFKLGFKASKLNKNSAWFVSPFRNEKTPSFKVDLKLNLWYDHGEGIGGNTIDLVMKLNQCSLQESLIMLAGASFSFHQQEKIDTAIPKYKMSKEVILENRNLIEYLNDRKIDIKLAKKYCCQIHYSFDGKKEFYGIGFKNDLGGYEIRNKFFKGCLGKKAITQIKNNSSVVSVFESWSDFLSYLTLKKTIPFEDFLILNSTSMSKNVPEFANGYSRVRLFLDNDSSGDSAANFLFENLKTNVIDERVHYKNHKDLNELLISLSINAV